MGSAGPGSAFSATGVPGRRRHYPLQGRGTRARSQPLRGRVSSNDFDGPPFGPASGQGADEQGAQAPGPAGRAGTDRARAAAAKYPAPEGWGNDGFWRDSAMDSNYETGMQSAVRPPIGSGDDPGYSYFSDGQGWQSAPAEPARQSTQPPDDGAAGATSIGATSVGPGAAAATAQAVTRPRSTAAALADTVPPWARDPAFQAARVFRAFRAARAFRVVRAFRAWARRPPAAQAGQVAPAALAVPVGPADPRVPAVPGGRRAGTASARAAGGGTGPGRRRSPSSAAWPSSSYSPSSAGTSTCRAARRSLPPSRRLTTRTRPSTTPTARRSSARSAPPTGRT